MADIIAELLQHENLRVCKSYQGDSYPDEFDLRFPLSQNAEHPNTRQKVTEYFEALAQQWTLVTVVATNRKEGSSLKISVKKLKNSCLIQCHSCIYWHGLLYPDSTGKKTILVCFNHPEGPGVTTCLDWKGA
jgi:hypothetical protein